MSFVAELKRRNVLRVAGLYVAGTWLVLQVAGTVLPMFDAPLWISRGLVVLLAIGFVPALVFAWAFEFTPEGLKREHEVDRGQSITPVTGRRLDRVIMGVLALALAFFAVDKFLLAPERAAAEKAAARDEGRSAALTESYGDKSIAVLPFADLSPRRDQAYLSDGIAEELLNQLAKIQELRVISRTSAFSFKDDALAVPEIARRLNVAHVLEGSVRRSGEAVRITAQLIDARSDTQLWSGTFDRTLADVFAIQDEIAAAVVDALKLELLGPPPGSRPIDPKAHALVLQAQYVYLQGTPEATRRAIELYEQALAVDPQSAVAWTGLAAAYSRQADTGERPVAEGYGLAREAAHEALEIDRDHARAHVILGRLAMANREYAQAAKHLERAHALAPTDPVVWTAVATLASVLGRFDEAIAGYEFVIARDPVRPSAHYNLALMHYIEGRPNEAIASARTALGLSPGFAGARQLIATSLLQQGDATQALAEIEQESDEVWRRIALPVVLHALGRRKDSDAALAELIRHDAEAAACNIAAVFAYRGERDRAFEWLGRADLQRDPGLREIPFEPQFANLHDDPRWLPFLRKQGLAPEQLAAISFDVDVPGH